ncbi:O-antigen polymerase [Pseudogulbenkiania subflava]|uniref:Oligosaccharide repeat unit polymerase n=1 Tax=Pseudogulbenkiania subflava DSM 22618 TaxID=1123014 RepID=A0A1Y6BI67_9NEIS|nr:O-antigen polymerase [Pseudogulbenkiania subflava]SMF10677.1 hypothetical protein SAMN02745746_01326 [Pseudogulbenkiania subflava DSM 22618]
MNISHGKILVEKGAFGFFALLTVFSFVFAVSLDLNFDFVGLTFFALAVQSVFLASFFGLKQISLLRLYYLFSFIFLALVPWVHYSNNIIFWGGGSLGDEDYLVTNFLIFMSNFLILLVYYFGGGFKFLPVADLLQNKAPSKKVGVLLVLLALLSFFVLLLINNFSLAQIFLRGIVGEDRDNTVENSSLSLLLTMTSRMVPFFCFLYGYTQNKSGKILTTILLFILILSVFPTGVARYMVGFVYIPVLLIFFPALRAGKIFSLFLVFAIFIIFPFLNQFRKFDSFQDLSILPSADFFFEGHFDAYQNFARVVQIDFVTYGYQMLGSLFFYVPRFIWPNKPVGSGYEIAEQLGYFFNNISMPFLAEGYANFGVLGVFLFAVVIAFAMARLDRKYSFDGRSGERISYFGAVYLYLCGALFFVLRGDLLSSVAYVTAGLFSAFLVRFLCRFF